ncbi:complement C3-like protein [Labeo rohita]|uniref:Complement C3-like protein n=1 Tax=Labeo rohita TaxID=84645 RepID=A0A498L4Q9_LABRO|nr:complement C3-like protein [Labeo rohita]
MPAWRLSGQRRFANTRTPYRSQPKDTSHGSNAVGVCGTYPKCRGEMLGGTAYRPPKKQFFHSKLQLVRCPAALETFLALPGLRQDLRPFAVVEGKGFTNVAQELLDIGAKYGSNVQVEDILPCARTVSRHVEGEYEKIKLLIMEELRQNETKESTCPLEICTDLLLELGTTKEKLQATETRLNALETSQQELMSRLANSEAQIEEIKMENQVNHELVQHYITNTTSPQQLDEIHEESESEVSSCSGLDPDYKPTNSSCSDVEFSSPGLKGARKSSEDSNASEDDLTIDKVDIDKEFTVTARGTGTATLSVLTLYYRRPAEKESDCTFFDLTLNMDEEIGTTQPGAIETYKLTMDFIFQNVESIDATMTVIDIGLPTGFHADENDLSELSTRKDKYIQKYEKNKVLSERGSLILYLDKL